MNMRRMLAAVLALCMILTLAPVAPARAAESQQLEFEKLTDTKLELTQNPELEAIAPAVTMDPNEMVKVIIVLEGQSMVQEDSNVTLNAAAQNKLELKKQQQTSIVHKIEKEVMNGRKLDVHYQYTWLLNGVAATVPYGMIAQIKAVEGVSTVVLQQVYSICETTSGVATPNTATDGAMIGRESTWANGYTGEGMKIAIIDTGLDSDHQNFAALEAGKLTDTSVTAEDVAAVLASLNASSRLGGLTVENVYRSSKVVFGFNYCDDNLVIDHLNGLSDHGTHVAGIAAANKVEGSEVVGVAPDAQIMVMKVFGDNGGAYTMDILAALEDALMLGADVINMSLGSPAGFTSGEYTEEGDFLDEFYASIASTGTILSVSAGNNYNSAYSNYWGTDMNPTYHPDTGVVGSPGTYANTMTVASVENWKIQRNYIDIDGYHISYYDSGETYSLPNLISLTGSYQVVLVPGLGAPEDFEGLDLSGKVALIQRGSLSFLEKHQNAEAAGAVATLVYNNTTGEFGMDMTGSTCKTPAAAITLADAAYLIAALEENPELEISFPNKLEGFPTDLAYTMSDFSSVGPAPDLSLAPDITAPGGNIYSTVNNGQYGIMSGTSMAAPNIAGMTALVLQYVKETFPEGTDYRRVAQDLLMSTAEPLSYNESIAYSPRSQGAGLGNAFNAVTTNAYLTVPGADSVKADLGDDADRTGAYSFSFDIVNFSDAPAYYRLNTTVQTEDHLELARGLYFMAGTPRLLGAAATESSANMVLTYDVDNDGDTDSHDAYIIYQTAVNGAELAESFRCDVDVNEAVAAADVQAYLDALVGNDTKADLEDTILQVAAGETASVTVNVNLTAEDKAYFDTYWANGGYVEGFTRLTALHDGGVDLGLPYLGFYGDWADAPVLDEGSYWDYLNNPESAICNQYPHIIFSEFQGDEYGIYPGMNAYIEEEFDMAHISVSPNGDGYLDNITDLYLSLMRNASELTITYTNLDTDETFFDVTIDNVHKTVYYPSYGQIVPFAYDLFIASPTLPEWEGLENNTQVLLRCEVVGVAEGDEPEIWEVPITVDLEAPELLGAELVEQDGKTLLNLSFRDNLSAAVAMVIDGAGVKALAVDTVEDVAEDENGYQNYVKTFDITGISGKVMIILGDYAINESYYGINLGGEGTPYGDLVAYQYNFNTGTNGWVSFNADVNKNETTIFTNFVKDFVAAEYVNGYVYAQTEDGALYGFKYTDMLNNTMTLDQVFVAQLENVYQDFAYNYSDGKLYGLLTTEEMWYGEPSVQSEVFSINIKGEYYDEDMWATIAPYQEDWVASRGELFGLGLAIDDAGSFYIMGQHHVNQYDDEWNYTGTEISDAQLWKAEMEESWGWVSLGAFRLVGDTGVSMDFLQSMTWDHNAEKLYWARFDGGASFTVSELYEVDPTAVTEDDEGNLQVSCVKVGQLSGETCALFAPLSKDVAATEPHTNVPEMDDTVPGTPVLRESLVNMSIGGVHTLVYDMDPWYTSVRDVVWSSSNEEVATVDQNGQVTAHGAGSAEITVASAADETKFDTCTVEVSALTLKFEGIVSTMGSGIGNAYGARMYEFAMNEGVSSMTDKAAITAPSELNYGLSLATSEFARGSVWACEYGNTGMIYEINPDTGVVKNVFMPVDGDMMFGMHYSEKLDSFTNIMNFYMYTDLTMDEAMYEEMMNSYDEELNGYGYHRINMLPYLQAAGGSFVTGETGQGASSEVVFCAITGIDGGIMDSYGETYYYDTYKDYLGNWAMGGECSYQPVQTLILLDNVGRLWYINEVQGVTVESDEWGNMFLFTPEGGMLDGTRPGVIVSDYTDENGGYTVFHITKIEETPLTDMFRDGSMPRYTYHFSDIEFAGYTADGLPMIAMSLYDYWNNGITNKLYLYIPEFDTGEMDYETWEPIVLPARLYDLGSTGEYSFIASIHSAVVTGGVDAEEVELEAVAVNKLTAGVFGK